jgi:hypothetical protein
MSFVSPGPNNVWVPSWEATGQMIAFIRDPKTFPINNYIAFRPAKKMVGLYLKLNSSHASRVYNADQFRWPEGTDRPTGDNNTIPFLFEPYRTERYDVPVRLGNNIVNQADWQIIAAHTAVNLQQAMTLRTWQIVSTLDNASNWAGNTSDVDTLVGSVGATWANSTGATQTIRKSINAAVIEITRKTNGLLGKHQLNLVLHPKAAASIAESQEIIDMVKQSPIAEAQVRGESNGRNSTYGLPNQLYGVELVVENTVRNTAKVGATDDLQFVKAENSAFLTSKVEALPGDHVADMGSTPNFSTFQLFYYDGESGTSEYSHGLSKKSSESGGLLVVEMFNDVRNKRTEVHVVENYAQEMVAPESGYLFTSILTT